MLLAEDGGGAEDGDLAVGLDDLEGGADGDFGFAEADVAANEAVHGELGFEIGFDFEDGVELGGGFDPGEGVFHFALVGGVGAGAGAGDGFSLGVEADELAREFTSVLAGFSHGALPFPAAEFVEFGRGFTGGEILLDAVELFGREEEFVGAAVFDEEELFGLALDFTLDEATVDADAMGDVDHVVAGFEVEDGGNGDAFIEAALGELESSDAEELLVGDEGDFEILGDEAASEVAFGEEYTGLFAIGPGGGGEEFELVENALDPVGLVGGDVDLGAGIDPVFEGGVDGLGGVLERGEAADLPIVLGAFGVPVGHGVHVGERDGAYR